MTPTEKQAIQRVINTLDAHIPVVGIADMDAKLGCIMTLKNLIAPKNDSPENPTKEKKDG